MKYLFSKLLGLTLVLVGLSACSNDDSAQSPQLGVNFRTVTTSFDTTAQARVAASTLATGSFNFDEGSIILKELEFEAETENDSTSVEFELNGIVVIDFATGIPTPDIRPITIPAGTYQEVEVEIDLIDENDTAAIDLTGSYTFTNGEISPVSFQYDAGSGLSFEVEREGTIVFTADQSAIAQITFDPSVWFAGVTETMMTNATKNSEGVIVISNTQNSDIFNVIDNGLELATDLEIDN